ncbi:MAG TPA: acyl-CoA dehydrogenase family protein [Steroidobacteraceae bacterium]|nr:acyl-CoA dehydrogenase family protein [Steroidobacteraceae bacterium]
MDFELTEDQTVLRDSLQRLLAHEYSFERRRRFLDTPHGHDAEFWKLLAGQGVLGAGLPEEHGGLGGPTETMIVMEEIGRSLVLEPYMSTVVTFGGLLRDHGSEAQRATLLPAIIRGECRGALAHHEAGARYDLGHVGCTARRAQGSYVLNGSKTVVQDGAVADWLVVSARGEETGGLSLFLVGADTAGLRWTRYRTHDGRSAADVTFVDARIAESDRLGAPGTGLQAVEQAADLAIAALCAEAVGAMEALQEATLQYLKTRRQFGQPIGRFQVLQHRMADLFLMSTQARSMSFLATGRCRETDGRQRRRALSAAKAYIGRAARFVGQQAVQLHGGMGMTAELSVSHYFKRLTLINATWGDTDHHTGIVGDLLLDEAQ